MLAPNPLAWIARRLGVDRGRALANASPHAAQVEKDRREQYEAIQQRSASW